MTYRQTNLCTLLCLASWLSVPDVVVAVPEAAKPDTPAVLEITKDTVLDPAKTYGPIVNQGIEHHHRRPRGMGDRRHPGRPEGL